jgi:chromosome segregation ATPase
VPDPVWTNIVRLQQEIKRLSVLAAENQIDSQEFLQPILEQRSALDHICRAKAAETGLFSKAPGSDYVEKQYDKAIGHLYRAFFDVADWLGLTIKEKILELATPYDADVIQDVMPEYYRDVRPRIEGLIQEVADIRSDKDIGQTNTSLIKQVDEYAKKVRELLDMYAKLLPKVPALRECQRKRNKEKSHKTGLKILEIVVTIILTAVTTWLFTRDSNHLSRVPTTTQPISAPAGTK